MEGFLPFFETLEEVFTVFDKLFNIATVRVIKFWQFSFGRGGLYADFHHTLAAYFKKLGSVLIQLLQIDTEFSYLLHPLTSLRAVDQKDYYNLRGLEVTSCSSCVKVTLRARETRSSLFLFRAGQGLYRRGSPLLFLMRTVSESGREARLRL